MTADSKVVPGSPPSNAAQRAWLSELSKLTGGGGIDFDLAVEAKAAPGGAGAPAPGGPGAPAPEACVTPDATPTDFFFDYKSAELTASDKTFLAAYAKAYLSQNIEEKIEVQGFASTEGAKDTNDTLSKNRAAQVVRYLIAQKVPKQKVKDPIGNGPTDSFSPTNLCLNRRATITPALDLKVSDFVEVVETEPRNVPTGKEPNLTLGEKAPEPDMTNVKIPEPCPMVSRDVVEAALEEWLIALGQAQKIKTREQDMVMTSKRVNLAEQTLLGLIGEDGDTREGPQGQQCGREDLGRAPVTPFNGDDNVHKADALAKDMTQGFPKRIPEQNLVNFLKLRPVEAPVELSLPDQIRAKANSLANEVLSDFGVPRKYWGKIKEFVKNKTPDLIDTLPVDDKVKDAMKKGYKKLAKIDDEK